MVEAPGATNNKENLEIPKIVSTTISLITAAHSTLFNEQESPPQSSYPIFLHSYQLE